MTTTQPPPYAGQRAGLDLRRITPRLAGTILLAASAVLLVMLTARATCDGGSAWNPGFSGGGYLGLFGWSHGVLLGLLAASGVGLLVADSRASAIVPAALGLAPSAQLAGAAVVARQRWLPKGGMIGCGVWTNMTLLETIAVIGAVAAAAAFLACLALLASHGFALRSGSAAFLGLLVAIALPVLLSRGNAELQDATSIGAFALLWSLPWGVTLALSGALHRTAALAAAAAVAVGALVALPTYQLVQVDRTWVALVVGLAAAAVVVATRTARSELVARP